VPARPSPATAPAQSRFADVIDAATELFSEHGYNGTTVRMIADELGILSGSLYSHISRKEDILVQIARQTGMTFLERAERAVAGIEDPEAALRAICAAHLEVLDEQQTAVTVYYNEWRRISSPAREEIVALRDRYQAMITDWVKKGIRIGAFEPADPRMGVLMILSMLNWSYQWYRHDGGIPPRQLGEQFMDAIVHGLARRP
jgi:TetR/AcrR family transcriptional regulator, cholesterol catabolism regulator